MQSLDLVAGWHARAAAGVLVGAGGDRSAARVGEEELRPGVLLAGATGDPGRRYPWASLTKLCTALAVLVAVEEGTLALSDPAGPPGATVAHLLAHASGLAPDRREAIAPPARRRIYSNAGYEVLGDLLAERAGMPACEYVAAAVFAPAGMTGARLASGASLAHGVEGTLSDLLELGAELLAPRVVAPETLAAATAVAFPGLAGVLPGFGRQDPNDWGLGFELRDAKHPHWTGSRNSPGTFGHFGRSGSFLWVDPAARAACGVLCDRSFGPWAVDAWPVLSDAVLGTLGERAQRAKATKGAARG
ncbi:MAG: serine hydrolase [Actinomycetota bacterium]|jgi:CubicO group peptidase (beta-lactamase class C family)|nr:serine hydrolase [Actinomycetota bacterium]